MESNNNVRIMRQLALIFVVGVAFFGLVAYGLSEKAVGADKIAIWSAVGVWLSATASSLALCVAWSVYKGQANLNLKLQEENYTLSQRQLIVPLWEYVQKVSLSSINPQNPVGPDVVNALNCLELIAVCVEGGMIDPQVITRTFGDVFLSIGGSIEAITQNVPGHSKNGKQMFEDASSAYLYYQQLKKDKLEANRLQSKTGGQKT